MTKLKGWTIAIFHSNIYIQHFFGGSTPQKSIIETTNGYIWSRSHLFARPIILRPSILVFVIVNWQTGITHPIFEACSDSPPPHLISKISSFPNPISSLGLTMVNGLEAWNHCRKMVTPGLVKKNLIMSCVPFFCWSFRLFSHVILLVCFWSVLMFSCLFIGFQVDWAPSQ